MFVFVKQLLVGGWPLIFPKVLLRNGVEIAIRKFEALLCFTRNESFGGVTSGGHFETGCIRDKRQFGYLKLTRSKKHVDKNVSTKMFPRHKRSFTIGLKSFFVEAGRIGQKEIPIVVFLTGF